MKKYFFYFLFLVMIMIPARGQALSSDYVDVVAEIVETQTSDDKLNIYFFYGNGCPHCAQEEKFFRQLKKKYDGKIELYTFETWDNMDNQKKLFKVKETLNQPKNISVPFTVIGNKFFSGYSGNAGKRIEQQVRAYLELKEIDDDETLVEQSQINIPLFGEVNVADTAVGVAAIILGFVDGFNPCAMWILLFLINMLLGMKDKRKMFFLGISFLFTSSLFYFLSMLGINVILGFISTNEIRSLIGVVAIIGGLYNLYVYYKERNDENGCHVVDEKKRKNIIEKVKKIKNAKNFVLALLGIVTLAVSVNMVELACSAGFPTIFSEILVANNVTGMLRIVYLLLYVLFYMLDDMVIFTISMCTLSVAGMTTKYNKIIKVVGGVIMIIMGILLIFKPAWVMLNFG